jgi:hypothetical protein
VIGDASAGTKGDIDLKIEAAKSRCLKMVQNVRDSGHNAELSEFDELAGGGIVALARSVFSYS